jgi:hypothetical protein
MIKLIKPNFNLDISSTFVVVVGVVVVVEVLVDVKLEVGEVASVVAVVVDSTNTACVVDATVSVGAIVLAMVSATADVSVVGANCSVGSASFSRDVAEVDADIGGADGIALVAALLRATELRSAVVVALTLRLLLIGADAALQRLRPQHNTILPRVF